MSAKLMGQVYDLDLPHNKAWVLMAMVDHADHIGRNIFPSLSLIAWKTGYSLKQVRRIVKDLVTDGILIEVGNKPGYPKSYRADLSKALRKPEYVIKTIARKATQNVPTQNGSGDMPREERKSSTPSQVSLTSEHEPSLKDNRQKNMWYDAVFEVWGYTAALNTNTAKMLQGVATDKQHKAYNLDPALKSPDELLAWRDWYKSKYPDQRIYEKLDKIQSSIGQWQAIGKPIVNPDRTANGHETDTLVSQWDTDNEPIREGVDYT